MEHLSFEAIIVGAGQAASLAGRLTKAGWSVALIERAALGGNCINRGCTPTKAMIASAQVAYAVSRGADYGIIGGEAIRVDLEKAKARKDAIVASFRAARTTGFFRRNTYSSTWELGPERCTRASLPSCCSVRCIFIPLLRN